MSDSYIISLGQALRRKPHHEALSGFPIDNSFIDTGNGHDAMPLAQAACDTTPDALLAEVGGRAHTAPDKPVQEAVVEAGEE